MVVITLHSYPKCRSDAPNMLAWEVFTRYGRWRRDSRHALDRFPVSFVLLSPVLTLGECLDQRW